MGCIQTLHTGFFSQVRFWCLTSSAVVACCFLQATTAQARVGDKGENSPKEGEKPPEDDSVITLQPQVEPTDDGWTEPKVFSPEEKKLACRKYENKYIADYDRVYKVEKCTAREIRDDMMLFDVTRKGNKILRVDSDVVALLEVGKPIEESITHSRRPIRSCKQLKGKYVTYTYSDMYYVEDCKKRIFSDWTTAEEHRRRAKRKDPVMALSWYEFGALKDGEPMPNLIDPRLAKELDVAKTVDVIPLDQACKGVNNQDVTYVDRVYRIEKCRKREYDIQNFMKRNRGKIKELTSEQWLSIPDGAAMPVPKR